MLFNIALGGPRPTPKPCNYRASARISQVVWLARRLSMKSQNPTTSHVPERTRRPNLTRLRYGANTTQCCVETRRFLIRRGYSREAGVSSGCAVDGGTGWALSERGGVAQSCCARARRQCACNASPFGIAMDPKRDLIDLASGESLRRHLL